MSWSVVTRPAVSVDAVMHRLAAEPAAMVNRDLRTGHRAGHPRRDDCLWFVDQVTGRFGPAVALMAINGFQASRPTVLRRLSADGNRVHSMFWNVEHDNAFNSDHVACSEWTIITGQSAWWSSCRPTEPRRLPTSAP
jgi:hypothetical protein